MNKLFSDDIFSCADTPVLDKIIQKERLSIIDFISSLRTYGKVISINVIDINSYEIRFISSYTDWSKNGHKHGYVINFYDNSLNIESLHVYTPYIGDNSYKQHGISIEDEIKLLAIVTDKYQITVDNIRYHTNSKKYHSNVSVIINFDVSHILGENNEFHFIDNFPTIWFDCNKISKFECYYIPFRDIKQFQSFVNKIIYNDVYNEPSVNFDYKCNYCSTIGNEYFIVPFINHHIYGKVFKKKNDQYVIFSKKNINTLNNLLKNVV